MKIFSIIEVLFLSFLYLYSPLHAHEKIYKR